MAMTEEQRRRVEGSYTGETGGGTSWTPKRYRAPKRIKPPKVFSSDVKTQNRWVENVTSPVVDRVAGNSDRPVTLDDIEALPWALRCRGSTPPEHQGASGAWHRPRGIRARASQHRRPP